MLPREVFAAIGIAIGMSVLRAREDHRITTFGSARWASKNEVRTAGLLGPDGVILGCIDDDYLRHNGPEHVLSFAPTRSGKGVGLVIPTLLTWPGRQVHDIKGENWRLTAGWRARFGRVLLFDPTNAESSAYNPLLESAVATARPVTSRTWQTSWSILKARWSGAIWEKTSHSLLVGAILHVLYAEPDKTLAGVANFLSDPKRPIEATLQAMMRTAHLGDHPHPVAASAARELLNQIGERALGCALDGNATACFELVALKPGESVRVSVRADPRLLAMFDRNAGRWRIAAGTYHFALAPRLKISNCVPSWTFQPGYLESEFDVWHTPDLSAS